MTFVKDEKLSKEKGRAVCEHGRRKHDGCRECPREPSAKRKAAILAGNANKKIRIANGDAELIARSARVHPNSFVASMMRLHRMRSTTSIQRLEKTTSTIVHSKRTLMPTTLTIVSRCKQPTTKSERSWTPRCAALHSSEVLALSTPTTKKHS